MRDSSPARPRWGTGRDPVAARRGMVSTGHPLATAAGIKILRDGGNAFDAAIAAAAVIAVVEPSSNHLGGDVFALCRPSGQEVVEAINASGPAGARADLASLDAGIPRHGVGAATVPGAVSAWETILARHGTMPLADVLVPAIEYAESGFPVALDLSQRIAEKADVIAQFPASAAALIPGGAVPAPGRLLVQRDLAETLRAIAGDGAAGFYQGPFAEACLRASDTDGGFFAADDLATPPAEVKPPLRTFYRGYEVIEQPLVSQGFIVLEELNIVEGFNLGEMDFGAAESIHLLVEAKKLAFSDRHGHAGDPAFVRTPIDRLISKEFAAQRRMAIDPSRATAQPTAGVPGAGGSDTTSLSAADESGNCVTYIQSLFELFGSAYVVPGTGVLLNNRMRGFSTDPESPNVVAPGKRPIHTLNTFMLRREGVPVMFGATRGGHYQVQANLQAITNVIDFGMHWQEALDAPRWHHDEETGVLYLESRFDSGLGGELALQGHKVEWDDPFHQRSRTQGIVFDPETGTLFGGTDPRWHGQVLGF